jgi:hypothetical protein
MLKGFGRLNLADKPSGKRKVVDATRYVTTTCTHAFFVCLCLIRVLIRVVLLIGMASSSSAPALSKELHERFGDTQGSDEHFIEQCASTQIL